MSPTFYVKFLFLQIQKAHKNTVKLSVLFVNLGSAFVKAARKMLVKLTPRLIRTFFKQVPKIYFVYYLVTELLVLGSPSSPLLSLL
jgi:hypothetical protein